MTPDLSPPDRGAVMRKYGFKIRTRGGMVVDNLAVHGRTREEAEGRIAQIYQQCEILECQELAPATRGETLDLEGMITLIGRQESGEGK